MINRFLQYLRYEKGFSSHTEMSYRTDLIQFAGFVSHDVEAFDPSTVTSDEIRAWIVLLLEEGDSPRSVNRKVSTLKSFYRFLNHSLLLNHNPTKKIVSLKTKKPLPLYFKGKEINFVSSNMLEKTFEEARDKLIIEILYQTGVRCSELIGIKDSDIDFDRKTLRVLGKRNKERLIPFGETLRNAIRKYMTLRDEAIDHPAERLITLKTGVPVYSKLIYNKVHSAFSGVSTLTQRSPHVLRHTFATTLLNNGAELNAVKELLGHSHLSATEIYTHTTFDQIQTIYKQAHPRAQKRRHP
ncbi:tyrosine-type recombinase/integrase [Microbacter margulisiae]|uniref:Integrase/recombinase XerC n=1 Tax=Microbacter margulisiae TaxID=1350067 RepID=A0A7W5DRL5_9PORP|nr:tyrosine-type recombinase/integrase [Microbacter margulisiae]MBB3187284.1 integrase/recombinase XerC [Microbacter margulisiae]